MPEKERLITLLTDAIDEMELLGKMSADIKSPDDFVSNLTGMTIFRACGMSLPSLRIPQYRGVPFSA